MRNLACTAILLPALGAGAAQAATATACHATLTAQDARAIATRIPNARAFAENQHATLETAVAGHVTSDALRIRVTAREPGAGPVDVGVYTVNLRTGAVIDDDQEPADDAVTQAEEARLLAKRCVR